MGEDCAWIFKNGKVLLEQQTGVRWHGLWKLPIRADSSSNRVREESSTKPLLSLEYPFTHHRVTLTVFAEPAPHFLKENQEWFPVDRIESVAMTAPHRRALNRLIAIQE